MYLECVLSLRAEEYTISIVDHELISRKQLEREGGVLVARQLAPDGLMGFFFLI
jgi:hypothetical protein